MEPKAHCSNEDAQQLYPDPISSSRFIIKSQDSKANSENSNKPEDPTPSKTHENYKNDEEILRVENLFSPEVEFSHPKPPNDYQGFIILSSGSEEEEEELKRSGKFPKKSDFYDSSKENSEKLESVKSYTIMPDKVRFSGEKTQFVQYYSAKQDKNRVRFVELFDENQFDEDDLEIPNKKRKLCFGFDQLDSENKNYKLVNEIQKLKIMQIIEECFLKLAEDGVLESALGLRGGRRGYRVRDLNEHHASFSCKRFILPWIMVKIIQIILCNIMLFTFISEGTYFVQIKEFLPLAVTFYLTLFLILATLLSYISCFTYSLVYNPFYMWCVIASALLTTMTTSGIFIQLCLSGYHESYLQVTVLFLSAALLSCILGELFLCYFELKRCMNQIGPF